ncbi:ecdysone receptor isoform X2 [Trichogramma pretiosum]|uniref:Ecdysone receptor n=1 Tax=Trichogramma kaykai TaxID=54128 RepID=A0ABD2VUL7_9HYME|nr:ecdysone receptor isoform X2 [Trichogramma pretiosum]
MLSTGVDLIKSNSQLVAGITDSTNVGLQRMVESTTMLQDSIQPRLPVAGIKRRWGGRIVGSTLQPDSSNAEVTSSVLSPTHYQPTTPETTHNPEAETANLWDLDLHIRTPNNTYQQQQLQTLHNEVTSPSCGSIIEGRDDLSPPSSLNGYNMDSCDAKRRKGPTPRQQEELCLVCGDRASGYHYNALTCEGCKGFFRRSITKNAVYQCKYGNSCEIDMYMRRKCQECRLKKCLHVGMRPECVVPEFQCAVKRKEKKAQKDKDKPVSTSMNGSPNGNEGSSGGGGGGAGGGGGGALIGPDGQIGHVKTEPAEPEAFSHSDPGTISIPYNGRKHVSPEQEELINRLVFFQDEFEAPNEEDVKRITQSSENEDPSDVRFRHITEITILTVQLIVEFAKRLPGFDKLRHEDKIVLLKACSSEVMILRMARKYDNQTDSIIFANNQAYSRDSYTLAGIGNIIDDLLHFGRLMYSMQVNNAEYALLTAIVIFSDRPNVSEGWKVEKIQEIYLNALKAYVESWRKPKASAMFAKLLSVLTELRTLGNQNSETCSNLKLKNKKLPPFLAEIWDVAS